MRLLAEQSELVALDTLDEHPENPNDPDEGAVHASIEALGFFGGLVAQRSTRRVLAGHTRRRRALALGISHLPVFWVDVDDDTARRILLADNRTNRRGSDREPALMALLQAIATDPAGLVGTGYDGDDLDALLADAARSAPLALGADDAVAPSQAPGESAGDGADDGTERHEVVLVCASADERREVAARLASEGYRVKPTRPVTRPVTRRRAGTR